MMPFTGPVPIHKPLSFSNENISRVTCLSVPALIAHILNDVELTWQQSGHISKTYHKVQSNMDPQIPVWTVNSFTILYIWGQFQNQPPIGW